jgi:hypothetical protein
MGSQIENFIPCCINYFKDQTGTMLNIYVAACKDDLTLNLITKKSMEKYCLEKHFKFYKASAKNGLEIQSMFHSLAKDMHESKIKPIGVYDLGNH